MATTTFHDYTGDGSDTTFDYSFPTFSESEVVVEVGGVIVNNYTIPSYQTTGTRTVTFDATTGTVNTTVCESSSGAPKDQLLVRIRRNTNIDSAKADYTAGSSLKAADLTSNNDQLLRASQDRELKADVITTVFIKDQAITKDKIALDAIDGTRIADDAVDSEHLAADSIDAEHYAPGSVDATALGTNSVIEAKINSGAVTQTKIGDGSIINVKVDNNAAIAGTKINPNFGSQNIATTGTAATGAHTVTGNLSVSGTAATGTHTVTGNISVSGTVDGRDVAADGSKLDGIEAGATADQTDAQIKAAYENNANTNAYTDTEKTFVNAITATATELNILDGVTANKDEINILDQATLNTNELNKLDGFTGSTADLNEVVTGKNVVETISSNATDAQIPTAQAVNERITTVVSDVGGFVPIANETSFPTDNPDLDNAAGTIVSIKALSSSFTTGSGVTTHTFTNGAGSGNNVTITGLTASTTYPAGRGMLLETTTTSGNGSANPPRAYAFHRLTLDETGVAAIQVAIDDWDERYYGPLSSEPSTRPSGAARVQGDLYFNTANSQMKVWNNAASQWDNVASAANSNIVTLTPAFDGSETEFTCSTVPVDAQSLLLSINGVIQKPNSGTSTPSEGFVKLANGKIKLATAPATGSSYFAVSLGNTVSIGTPSDNTVTSAKIVDGSIVNADISSSAAIARSKLEEFVSNNGNNRVITGSNTTNTLDGNPTLIFDGTNLGVGGSPSGISNYSTLHLKGATSGAGGGIRLQDHGDTADSDDFLIYKNSAAGYIRINGTDPIKFYMNGGDRLEITSTGDLNVSGTTTGSTSTPSAMARISLGSNHSSSVNGECKIKVWADATDQMGFGISNNQLNYITTQSTYDHVFYGGNSGTSELLRVRGSSDYIDIAGSQVLTFNSQAGQIDVNGTDKNFRFLKVSGSGYIHISNNNGHVYVDANNTGTIYLRSGNNSGGIANAIVCNANGQVDIYHAGTGPKLLTHSQGIKVTHGSGGSGNSSTLPILSMSNSFHDSVGGSCKIKVYDGGGTDEMGFGISNNQLDYITHNETWDHVFYGGNDGNAELLRIHGDRTKIEVVNQNLVFDNGYGIDFSNVSTSGSGSGVSVSGSVLDDYEEGTWTPVMSASGGGGDAWSTSAGHYTKIGNVVHARFSFQNYGGNLSGTISIATLPFSNSFRQYIGDFGFYKFTLPTNAIDAFIYVPTGTTVYPYWSRTGATGLNFQGADFNNGAYFEGTISYKVA